MLEVDERIAVPLRELRFSYTTSQGPGGQNVNRRSTRATLRWNVTRSKGLPDDVRERFLERYARRITSEGEVSITSQRFRDQGRNSADCVEKLRHMLADVARAPRARRPGRPSRSAVERRLREKRARATRKRERARTREPAE